MNSTAINLRLPPPLLAALDQWIAERGEGQNRPEAIRQILDNALGGAQGR